MNVINAEDKFEAIKLGGMLSRMLKMIADHDESVLKNPFPYLKAAYDDIVKHRQVFEEIESAAFVNMADMSIIEDYLKPLETISIPKEDYARYKKVMSLVSQFGEKL